MTPLQQAILAYLQQNAIGRANAKTADVICNEMIQQGQQIVAGRTQEEVRAAVRSMINDHSQLIGSQSGFNPPNGYYIIQNKNEILATIADLENRSQSMLARVVALRNEWNAQSPNDTI